MTKTIVIQKKKKKRKKKVVQKMNQETLTFDNIKADIKNVDTDKKTISKKVFQGFQYFIGYKDDKKINPFCIIFPKIREPA